MKLVVRKPAEQCLEDDSKQRTGTYKQVGVALVLLPDTIRPLGSKEVVTYSEWTIYWLLRSVGLHLNWPDLAGQNISLAVAPTNQAADMLQNEAVEEDDSSDAETERGHPPGDARRIISSHPSEGM